MSEYHHSQRTRFTSEEVAASVGKRATLVLEGTIVGWRESENGPFVMFQIDERFGFGVYRLGLDLELLHAREPAEKEGERFMSSMPEVGDRIELVEMGVDPNTGNPDPAPMEAGSRGTVTRVLKLPWDDQYQIGVDWDEDVGRSLNLITPPDKFRIIERPLD